MYAFTSTYFTHVSSAFSPEKEIAFTITKYTTC